MKMPSVSLILPIFTSPEYLSQALKSIKNQVVYPDELVIVDDCNSMIISNLIKKFEKKYRGGEVKIIQNTTPLGISLSTQKALELSDSEYVAFMDSDDLLSRNAIQTVKHVLKEKAYGALSSEFSYFEAKPIYATQRKRPTTYSDSTWVEIIGGQNFFTHFRVLKKEHLKGFNWDDEHDGIQDILLNFYLDKTDFIQLPDILYFHRLHEKQVSKNFLIRHSKNLNLARQKFLKNNGVNFLSLDEIEKEKLIKVYNDESVVIFGKNNRVFKYKNLHEFSFYNFDKFDSVIINLNYFTPEECIDLALKFKINGVSVFGVVSTLPMRTMRLIQEFWGVFDLVIVNNYQNYQILKIHLPSEAPIDVWDTENIGTTLMPISAM
jgi:glycosyltransferase involved in cell wall biosynthesis